MDISKIKSFVEFYENEVAYSIEAMELISDEEILVDDESYLVLTESEAMDRFKDIQEGVIDDLGLEGFSEYAVNKILSKYIDEDFFDRMMNDYYENYIEEMRSEDSSNEEYSNRLEEEMADSDCENEEEFLEWLIDGRYSVDWYISEVGESEFNELILDNPHLIDWDEVIQWIAEEDGMGILAAYDGQEFEYGDYYIYRID